MTRQAVSRSVLSDQVKDRLLQAILDGRYPPGARIVETRVARELGTSQAPVREALRDLEGLGLVVTAAFRGARVRRPSADELLEAFAVRSVLESLAIELAIPKLGAADLEALAADIGRMQAAADAGDVYAEATADAAFHGRIVEAARNATLVRVWRTLEPFSRTYITIGASGADRRQIADGHLPILEALRRREPGQGADVIARHFQDAAAGLARHWATSRAASPAPPSSDARDGEAASLPQLTRQLA